MQLSRPGIRRNFPPLVFAAGLLVVVAVCYGPALNGGLVWDDAAHVTRTELQSWHGLGRIWTDLQATQQYYPVLFSAFWIEHRLWGDATLGYHLMNVMWHALACVLLAQALRRLWRPTGVASGADSPAAKVPQGTEWLAAALLAVHPLCVESVAWISEQKNTLSLVFYLSSAILYLKFHDTRAWKTYLGAAVFFILALGTKSVTSTLPAALLVVLWWKQGRLDWRRDIVPLVPWFAVAIAAGLFTAWVERTMVGARGAAFDLNLGERFLLAGRVIWFYLGKIVWPANLMFIYPHWDVRAEAPRWFGWGVAVLAVTAVLWGIRQRTRGPLALWLFFTGSLFPALGFFNVYPFQFSYVADHFQYLPALGIFVGVAVAMGSAISRASGLRRFVAVALCGTLLGVLAMRTHRQSRDYRDSQTLYRATLSKNPACWLAHNNLGAELAKSPGGVSEAILHYRAALEVQPENAESHNNLGNALLLTAGGLDEALTHFKAALDTRPQFAEARLNFANALALLPQRISEALTQYAEAIRLSPESADVHFCFANTLAKIPERRAEALAEYRAALRLKPDYLEAHCNFAALLAATPGSRGEALAQYEAALRLAPSSPKIHYNLAVLLESLPGRERDARAHYEEALRLDPAYAEAHNNLGTLFARSGNLDQAETHWEAAIRLKPDYADPKRNLMMLRQIESRR